MSVDARYRALRAASQTGALNKRQCRDLKRTRRIMLDHSGSVEAIEAVIPAFEKWRNGNNWRAEPDTPANRTKMLNARAAVVAEGLEQLAKASKGVSSPAERFFRVGCSPKGSKILQSAMKHGGQPAVARLIEALNESPEMSFCRLLADQHGQNTALAIFEYADKDARRALVGQLEGHVQDLVARPGLARSVDRIYAGAGALQFRVREYLYEHYFAKRCSGGDCEDKALAKAKASDAVAAAGGNILAGFLAHAAPVEAERALSDIHALLLRAVDAGAFSTLVVATWSEFLRACPTAGLVSEGVAALAPVLPEFIDSTQGCELACFVIGLASPAMRKKAARALASAAGALELAAPAATGVRANDSAPFEPVLKLLLSTDDTVLLRRSLVDAQPVSEDDLTGAGLATDMGRLIGCPTGLRLLLGVIKPFDRTYLRPWQLDMLLESSPATLPVGRAALVAAGREGAEELTMRAAGRNGKKEIITLPDFLAAEDSLATARKEAEDAEAAWAAEHPNCPPLADVRAAITRARADPDPNSALEALAADGPLAGIDLGALPRPVAAPGLCKKDLAERVRAARAMLIPHLVSFLLADDIRAAPAAYGDLAPETIALARVSSLAAGFLQTSLLVELVRLLRSSADIGDIGLDRTEQAARLEAVLAQAMLRRIPVPVGRHAKRAAAAEEAAPAEMYQLEHTSSHAMLRRLLRDVPAVAPAFAEAVVEHLTAAADEAGRVTDEDTRAIFAERRGAILIADVLSALVASGSDDAGRYLDSFARLLTSRGDVTKVLADAFAAAKKALGAGSPTLIEPVTPAPGAARAAPSSPALAPELAAEDEAPAQRAPKTKKDKKGKKDKKTKKGKKDKN